jgi:TRAP-type mannitol/chloroaromatic compound transport system permease large subunit
MSYAYRSGVGAFATFVLGIARRRLSWEAVKTSVFNTGKATGMIFFILLGAIFFSYFLSVSGVLRVNTIGAFHQPYYIPSSSSST